MMGEGQSRPAKHATKQDQIKDMFKIRSRESHFSNVSALESLGFPSFQGVSGARGDVQ